MLLDMWFRSGRRISGLGATPGRLKGSRVLEQNDAARPWDGMWTEEPPQARDNIIMDGHFEGLYCCFHCSS